MLSELAEAVRVFKVSPYYFVSEGADVFAWLMKLQNLYEFNERAAVADRGTRLELQIVAEYPGHCPRCYGTSCHCPPFLRQR
jgi:hypothetical protein